MASRLSKKSLMEDWQVFFWYHVDLYNPSVIYGHISLKHLSTCQSSGKSVFLQEAWNLTQINQTQLLIARPNRPCRAFASGWEAKIAIIQKYTKMYSCLFDGTCPHYVVCMPQWLWFDICELRWTAGSLNAWWVACSLFIFLCSSMKINKLLVEATQNCERFRVTAQ